MGETYSPQESGECKPPAGWTVMVFMVADNVPGEADLTQAAKDNIAQMEQALALPEGPTEGASKRRTLEIAYQLHTHENVRRRAIGRTDEETLPIPAESDVTVLLEFVDWALAATNHSPDRAAMLVLWGHAERFAIAARPVGDRIDALDFGELDQALQRVQDQMKQYQMKQYQLNADQQLDIIAFDSCDLGTVEMAVQLHSFAKYMLASQIAMPIPGFPYDRILQRLAQPKVRLMGPAEFGAWAVRRFCERYAASDTERPAVSLTLLDLQQAPQVQFLAEKLGRALARALASGTGEQQLVVEAFRLSRIIDRAAKPFVDVADLCLNLLLMSGTESVRIAAQALGDFLLSPKPVEPHQSAEGMGKPFVVEHGHNTCMTARLNGVSLYAPHVAGPDFDAASVNDRYLKFLFAQKTIWNQVVTALIGLE